MHARQYIAGISLVSLMLLLAGCTSGKQASNPIGLGKPVHESYLQAWNIDIRADGTGLPSGSGTAAIGEGIYQQQCPSCHGDKGQGGTANRLVGGGSLNTDKPIKTVGSFWPYATTIFDYIRRAMPYQAPQSLSNDQVYALTAYILYLNKIIPQSQVIDAKSLPLVKMPNKDGFIVVEN